jgi:Dienelactone hydrolase and related enzymes
MAYRRTTSLHRGAAPLLIVGLFAIAALPLSSQQAGALSLAGTWLGTLEVQSQALRIVFNVSEEKGKLSATMDSPDQGAKGIPVSAVKVEGTKVRLELQAIRAAYEGELSADGTRLDGAWSQGGMKLPLALERQAGAFALARPQEPKAPFPYKVEEVAVENKKGGAHLAGSLVIPAGIGPFPAVVFVTGSGQQNRDEEIFGHKPFLVIADYLARRGVASLRCDDRGVGGSRGEVTKATSLDFADDAEAELEYLASRPEVKKGAVGIIGHSEGGLIAPIVASRNAKVSFIVLLAGPGVPGEELLYLQGAAIAKAQGASDAEVAAGQAVNRKLYTIAKGDSPEPQARDALKKAYLEYLDSSSSISAEDKAKAGQSVDQLVAPLLSPWFRSFLALDPASYLAKVKVPVLALNGSKDLQVPAAQDLAGIKAALGPAASPKNKLVELEGLNHLFQHAGTGAPDEYGTIEESFAPEALAAVGDWIVGLGEP